jgi:hypothetical protein
LGTSPSGHGKKEKNGKYREDNLAPDSEEKMNGKFWGFSVQHDGFLYSEFGAGNQVK